MTRPRPTPPPQPPVVVDPLAALRDPEPDPGERLSGPDLDPTDPGSTGDPEAPEAPSLMPLVTQEAWDQARDTAIVAMHADTTVVGFVHKGQGCGCRYIAGVILGAAMPVGADVADDLGTDGTEV